VNVDALLFYALAALVLVTGVLTVSSRNLVHAAFWMMPCFLGVGCLFLYLGNELLFAVQLAIYAGAIPIMVLFVLMLTREVMSEGREEHGKLWPLGLATALTFLLVAIAHIRTVGEPLDIPSVPTDLTHAIGEGFLTSYLLPFELASMLLLATMVGAVYLARADKRKGSGIGASDAAAGTRDAEVGVR
jgi:NADH-quinone oxidoreductase subunit J